MVEQNKRLSVTCASPVKSIFKIHRMIPKIGQKVPQFQVTDENGNIVSNDSLKGNKYILFFYPKDDTPGCTKEACNLRDNYSQIKKEGYQIFGISPDTEKKHQKFINKYNFQYSLLADPDKEMIKSFGLWGKKKFMGREIIGVYRTTFIVNEDNIISGVIEKVITKDHAQQILDIINV